MSRGIKFFVWSNLAEPDDSLFFFSRNIRQSTREKKQQCDKLTAVKALAVERAAAMERAANFIVSFFFGYLRMNELSIAV